jgi:hypothetical protein
MECAKMAHLKGHHSGRVPDRTSYKWAASLDEPAAGAGEAKASHPWTRQTEVQVTNTRRRIALMERMIADFERMAANLDRDILIEGERTNMGDLAHFTYLTCAKAIALRRDNLKRSADELRAHLAKAKKALIELGDIA